MGARSRKPISKLVQVRVFRRDGWVCRWCGRPVIFGPAMRYLDALARSHGVKDSLAYFHPNWTRRDAPLLDHLGAVIDHVEAHSRGGLDAEDNFATACSKCNARKNATALNDFTSRSPRRSVVSRYGEPVAWDGFSTLFLVLARQMPAMVTPSEAEWLKALDTPAHKSGTGGHAE